MVEFKRVVESEVLNERVVAWLEEKAPSITEVDRDVVLNGVVALEDDEILGICCFEQFTTYGLVRYFIFHSVISNEHMVQLFINLGLLAKEKDIELLFSVVKEDKKEVIDYFELLGFAMADKSKFWIDEQPFDKNEKYKDAIIMTMHLGGNE